MTKLTPAQRKEKTIALAQKIRECLKELEIQANVRCVFYKISDHDLILIFPKGKNVDALTHWERQSLQLGICHYLELWFPEHKEHCKIS